MSKTLNQLISELSISDAQKAELLSAAAKATSKEVVTIYDTLSGELLAIKCYYFQRYMLRVTEDKVEFGPKANSKTSLDSMCRAGSTLWYKQYNTYKKALVALKDDYIEQKVTREQYDSKLIALEQLKAFRETTTLGFATREEAIKYLKSKKYNV